MAPSYRHIHYVMRPAKNVERKLIAETVLRLSRLIDISTMRYVGMGSVHFADFSAFHRRLGFSEMHSIEATTDGKTMERFEFNKPYDTKLHFDHTNDVLPSLGWETPSVVWLDFDDILTSSGLADVDTVVAAASPPTVFLVTVNVEPGKDDGRRQRLLDEVGDELLPESAENDAALAGRKMGNVVREIFDRTIARTLVDRNGVLPPNDRVKYRQLFNFRYKDGARMLTIGGLLYQAATQETVECCAFEGLPFVRTSDEPFQITVPMLTVREALHLDAQLPTDQPLTSQGVPAGDVEAYARLYRYLPSFVDAEL